MRNIIYLFAIWATSIGFISCSDFLDVDPKDRVLEDALLKDDAGLNAYMSGMYRNLPIEDFRYSFANGFHVMRPGTVGATNMQGGFEAVFPHYNDHFGEEGRFNNWVQLYENIRMFCELKTKIPFMKPSNAETLKTIQGEYYFFMAYSYFALARRYGGVPIVKEVLQFTGDYDALKIPRTKEVDTWKYILQMCDSAVMFLPDATIQERANKWTAYALKSRASLYAASVGKFWGKDGAALSGEAVDKGLVGGFTTADISFFYQECINASAEVIKSGKYQLYGEEPATLSDAANNYGKLFTDGVGINEVMFLRRYAYPGYAHNMGKNLEPNQISEDWAGRCEPTLDMVETYQTINPETRKGTYNVKLSTTTNGNEFYDGYNKTLNYKRYDNKDAIFENRDPRMYATIILPNTRWGGETILIQGGIVRQDGSAIWQDNNTPYKFNNIDYYPLGNSDLKQCSGFSKPNLTMSGFLLKKYLKGDGKDQVWDQCTTPFTEMRYAEVLMNYAEAVAESGLSDAGGVLTAKEALNKIRSRAGFLDQKNLTPENVRAERRSEFGLEYYAMWDYFRRREFHTILKIGRAHV